MFNWEILIALVTLSCLIGAFFYGRKAYKLKKYTTVPRLTQMLLVEFWKGPAAYHEAVRAGRWDYPAMATYPPLTSGMWATLQDVSKSIANKPYKSEEGDTWGVGNDCEDQAMDFINACAKYNIPRSCLKLVTCKTPDGYHVIAAVLTDSGVLFRDGNGMICDWAKLAKLKYYSNFGLEWAGSQWRLVQGK